MLQQHTPVSEKYAYFLLQKCWEKRDLDFLRKVHSLVVQSGLHLVGPLADHLIRLFTSLSNLIEANLSFNNIVAITEYTCSALLSANSKLAQGNTAIDLYYSLQSPGIKVNKYIHLAVLKACTTTASLHHGRFFHCKLIDNGLETDVFVKNTLIDLYAKCGSLEEACNEFDKLLNRTVVSWGAIFGGYVQNGKSFLALKEFGTMQQEGIQPNKTIFLSILKACANVGEPRTGTVIHEQIITKGCVIDTVIGNTLVDMYAKSGSLDEAQRVFNRLPTQDVVSWSALIAAFAQHGEGHHAIDFFLRMQEEGIQPVKVTFLNILKACISIEDVAWCRLIHVHIRKNGFLADVTLGASLVDVYAKHGRLEEAQEIFDGLPSRDVVLWGAMINGYAQNRHGPHALKLFEEMKQEGVQPKRVTFLSILKACGSIGCIVQSRFIHNHIIQDEEYLDVTLGNTLVDTYGKSGSMEEACNVFKSLSKRDAGSFDALITGYAQHGDGVPALELFEEMQQEGVRPDHVTFLGMLKACGSIGAIEAGRQIHEHIIKMEPILDASIVAALVDMHVKCGNLDRARKVFDKSANRDIISWNVMIAGYAYNGNARSALQCLAEMQQEGIKPDVVTFACLLTACSHAGMVDEGRLCFFSMKEEHAVTPDIQHYNCLIDLYSRAGCWKEAECCFQILSQPDCSGWMSLLSACRTHEIIDLGEHCFDECVRLNPHCTSSYVLMSSIYAVEANKNKALG